MKQNYNALILKSVKITAGAILAILFASFLNLKYSATAGIITILSIQNTKKETIQTALARGEAFCCALLVSFLCYQFFRLYNDSFWHLSINIHNTLPRNEVVISNRHGFCSHYTFFSRKNNEYSNDCK